MELSPATRTFDCDLLRSANAGNYVFALGVDEVFAVENVFAGGSIAGECHTSGRSVTHVAVNHGLNVNGSTPFFGNLVHLAIKDSAFVHPAVEYCADGTPELFPSAFGEIFTGVFEDSFLEELNEGLEVVDIEFSIEFHAFFGFNFFDNLFEWVDIGFVLRLHAEYNVAVHLNETAIAVPSETRVT